ncbi:MAG: segregation/condensation protein A [Bryobacterales bacterium]|nr:segregation/condensation protein A [Bryobacteraceae bacterium]MDW8130329.1 segregation/condensation protein A [Bryobacterales bacterium]
MSSPLNVRLERYEGPLDLLLDLIRKQQIDIWDIPIARITQQYLDYLQQAAELDIELGAEFILMAATLIHIKSRMLLPRDPELARMEDEPEDPRRELVERLLEHERFKNAAEMLQQKRLIEENIWSNPQVRVFLDGEDPGLAVTVYDLVAAFQAVMERARNKPSFQVNHEPVTLAEMIEFLKAELLNRPRGEVIPARELFERQRSLRAMICLFLAILELVRLQAVALVQKETFGEIGIRRHRRFEEVVASPNGLDLEKEYT